MENNIHNKLTYAQMQDLFCDYAFNRISEEDKMAFENSLQDFPDLINELNDVKGVFSKVEAMDFKENISKRTRNLSVKVNSQISENSKGYFRSGIFTKLIIPSAALATILIVVFSGILNKPYSQDKTTSSNDINKNITGITSAEAKTIFDANDNSELSLEFTNEIQGNFQSNIELLAGLSSELVETAYSDYLLKSIGTNDGEIKSITDIGPADQYDLYDQLENLNEDDIQIILKELENADFNS